VVYGRFGWHAPANAAADLQHMAAYLPCVLHLQLAACGAVLYLP
jgi:hypothetical protein